jgi:hypothetical protein
MRKLWNQWFFLLAALLSAGPFVSAQSFCRNYMAEQDNGYAGFYIDVENQIQSGDTLCRLQNLKLILGVGNGATFTYVSTSGLALDQEYTATGIIGSGQSELKLNGVSEGTAATSFAPYAGLFDGDVIPTWASSPAEYVVVMENVQAVTGRGVQQALSFQEEAARPFPLFAFDPAGPRNAPLQMKAGDTATITVRFHISSAPNLTQYAPFVTAYGQSVYSNWPRKVTSDDQLTKRAEVEQTIENNWGVPGRFDTYGGTITPLWHSTATGYYRVEKKNGYWWLISPLGNPCFYKGIATAPGPNWDRAPITGRRYLFEWLPDMSGIYAETWSQAAWGDGGVYYLAFQGTNLIRKYGSSAWHQTLNDSTTQRVHTWGFSGLGKFSDPIGLPYIPGLSRGTSPNAVGTSHPDIFDPAIQSQIQSALSSQITPLLTNPWIVGWSVGNEDAEMVAGWEITYSFSNEGSTPLKRALTDYALQQLYGGDVQKLAAAWGIQASSIDDVYASKSMAIPTSDLESIRQYFEDSYYKFIYSTVKGIDPNHLYLGHWYLVGGSAKDIDWQILSKYVDVIGYDRYSYGLSDAHFASLLASTDKPALLGEFSFPPTYRMQRGFGAFQVYADDDAQAGDLYAQTLAEAASEPHVIGVDWFQYRDEPIVGRGPGSGTNLVYGEHFAFGLIDVTDTPKWAMIRRMRQANLLVDVTRLAHTLR